MQKLRSSCIEPVQLLLQFFPASRDVRRFLEQVPGDLVTVFSTESETCVKSGFEVPIDAKNELVINRQRDDISESLVCN